MSYSNTSMQVQGEQQKQFDWSSMIYDVFNKQDKVQSTVTSTNTSPAFSPLQYPKKESLSPLAVVNEEIWLDDLLSGDDQMLTQTRKNSISGGSSNSIFSYGVLESAATSFQNTPLIKLENDNLEIPSFIDLNKGEQQQQQQQEITRNSSIDSMFKDIFSDIEEEGNTTPVDSGNTTTANTSSTATPLNANGSETQVKQRKKRAPRKRLTDHQKQAHNKIEKRYRININAKIAGLQKIIPWVSGEKTAFEIGDELNDKDIKTEDENRMPRMNKSMILDKLTMYILYLQENEQKMRQENEELKKKLSEMMN